MPYQRFPPQLGLLETHAIAVDDLLGTLGKPADAFAEQDAKGA
ncbi:hypothetical protein [Rhizobium sp. SEMIA 4085]|nr:hypothetical protein [Rhizobium sp. SEMIA 4085]